MKNSNISDLLTSWNKERGILTFPHLDWGVELEVLEGLGN